MDEVRKKVLLDLFASPWTLIPLVGGLSSWLLSWGVNGNSTLNLVGLGGVLIGLGIQATRLIFGVEELTEKATRYLSEKERKERDKKLDQLRARLRKDDDPRTEECLRRLRKLYAIFEEEPAKGNTVIFREKVDKLFHAAIRQLDQSFALWEKAKRLPGPTKRPLLKKRSEAIDEVVLTVNHLTRTVEQYHAFQMKDSDDELAKLREELDATIEIARRADDRIDAMHTSKSYDEAEFENQ